MYESVGLSAAAAFTVALAAAFVFHFVTNAYFVFRTGAALAFRALDFALFRVIVEFTPVYISVILGNYILGLTSSPP